MPQNTQDILATKREELKKILADKPGAPLESMAKEHGLSTAQLIELLPRELWRSTDGSRFIEIMKELSKLGNMTIIINTGDVIFEYSGEVPNGGVAHGFYNLSSKSPLHGHLKHENCKTIYLIERPFMNTSTVSIQFANKEGYIMFKVYAGRDENRQLKADQVEALRAMIPSNANGAPA